MDTLEIRFNNALKKIRKSGIVARRNVMGCCRSCTNLELADDIPVIWHFGGQGNRLAIDGDDYNTNTIYFNHGNLVDDNGITASGRIVLDAFAENQIKVNWEQSSARCIEIDLSESLVESTESLVLA